MHCVFVVEHSFGRRNVIEAKTQIDQNVKNLFFAACPALKVLYLESGVSNDMTGCLSAQYFKTFYVCTLLVVLLFSTKKCDVLTKQRSIPHYLCIFSNQGAPQAQAPSPSEGRQLDGDGEWSTWLQINLHCHCDYILHTHSNTHTHTHSPFGQL